MPLIGCLVEQLNAALFVLLNTQAPKITKRQAIFAARMVLRRGEAIPEPCAVNVDEIVVEGSIRTTGSGPGRTPRPLRFARKVSPQQ